MWNLFTNLTKGKDRFVSLMISLVVLLLLYPVMIELGMMRIYGLVLSVELINQGVRVAVAAADVKPY